MAEAVPHCPKCKTPMRLVASVPAEKDLPAVQAFKCDQCHEAITREVE